MARRGTTGTNEATTTTGKPKALGMVTLLLALYAAGVSTVLLVKGGGSGGGGAGKAAAKGDLDPDRIARDVQLAVQSDLTRATREQKDALRDALSRLEVLKSGLQSLTETALKRTEDVTRTSSQRAEVLDARINDVSQSADGLKSTVDALAVTIKTLESRPAGVAPAGPTPAAPAKPPVAPPGPTPPAPPEPGAPPAGPTPEELAANKAKVKAAIADLAATDVGKVFDACLLLQRLGDLEAVEPLLKVLREYRDPYGRMAAAKALGGLHACDGVPGLIGAFLDKDPGVFLAASRSFSDITGQDSGLSGDASRKDKNEAKDKWTRWWKEKETEIRARWNQPKADVPPPGDAPK